MDMSKRAVKASLQVVAALGMTIGCASMQMADEGVDRSPAAKDEKANKSSLNGTRILPLGQKINTHFVDVADLITLCGADLTKEDNGRDPAQRALDLNNPSDQIWLRAELQKLVPLADKQKQAEKSGVQRRQCRVTKGMKKAMNEMANLMPVAFDGKGDDETQIAARQHLAILADVVSNQFRYPVPKKMDIIEAPVIFADREMNLIGEGNRGNAKNIGTDKSDDGTKDPVGGSTLWTRQNDISKKELYFGFGRKAFPLSPDDMIEYDGPKSGFGIHGGFDAKHGNKEYKIRFGSEVYTGAFNTRVFSALGFNVPIFDHMEDLKMKYDPRIFREYNKRAEMGFDLTLGWVVKIRHFEIQRYVDPIELVKELVLTNGQRIPAADVKKFLFKDPMKQKPELDEANWIKENESQIDHIALAPATVHQKDDNIDEVGGFDWNEVDYTYRREFRAVGILAAWVAWYDSRFDNTKLVFGKNGGIKHYLTDIGSGLGNTSSIISLSNAEANDFSWRLVEPRDVLQGDGGQIHGNESKLGNIGIFRKVGSLDFTRPFTAANTDDTKWMVRQIAQLTREQIKAALVATGLSAAEVRLILEKLAYRRDAMVRVYGMSKQFGQISKYDAPTEFNYDPRDPKSEKMSVTAYGATYSAPDQGFVVAKGVVCARENVVGGKCTLPKTRGAMQTLPYKDR